MKNLDELVEGYAAFARDYYSGNTDRIAELSLGQRPKVLVIACSDSRADPSILTQAEPGDIFVIRNVANLVPPYQDDNSTYHGTSAALEFAVKGLEVEHIIVKGHSGCAGIRALVSGAPEAESGLSFVGPWVKIAEAARNKVCCDHEHDSLDEQSSACEREALLVSYQNLLSFPWIKSRVDEGKLQLHAWHFDFRSGTLSGYDHKTQSFETLVTPTSKKHIQSA